MGDISIERCPVRNPAPSGYLIVDLETTSNARGQFRAIDGEKPYLIGTLYGDCATVTSSDMWVGSCTTPKVIVGHNIKFDLEHLRRHGLLSLLGCGPYAWDKVVLLDTQFITYLHSGHTRLFCSLADACV